MKGVAGTVKAQRPFVKAFGTADQARQRPSVLAIVDSMASTTTIAISPETRDALRGLAAERGDTMDSLITRLLRDERARRMGAALADRRLEMTSGELDDERALIAASTTAVARAIR